MNIVCLEGAAWLKCTCGYYTALPNRDGGYSFTFNFASSAVCARRTSYSNMDGDLVHTGTADIDWNDHEI